jgi:hypothetical protein
MVTAEIIRIAGVNDGGIIRARSHEEVSDLDCPTEEAVRIGYVCNLDRELKGDAF